MIKGTLEAETQVELKETKRKVKISKAISFSFLLTYTLILCWMVYLGFDKADLNKPLYINDIPIVIVDSISTGTKTIIDFIMYWQFIKLLRYFVSIRCKISEELGVEFTIFNRFVVSWTVLL